MKPSRTRRAFPLALLFAGLLTLALHGTAQTHRHRHVKRSAAVVLPTLTFDHADGARVGVGLLTIGVTASDSAGLKSLAMTGPNRALSSYFGANTLKATVKLYWNSANYPAGDYKFTATAIGNDGGQTPKAITLHLVK